MKCASGFVVCANDTASETQLKLSRQVHETISFQYMKTHNDFWPTQSYGRSNGTCGLWRERECCGYGMNRLTFTFKRTSSNVCSQATRRWCGVFSFPLRFVGLKRAKSMKRTAQYVRNCAIVYRFYVINFNDVINVEEVARPKWLAYCQRGTVLVLKGSVCISCGRLL